MSRSLLGIPLFVIAEATHVCHIPYNLKPARRGAAGLTLEGHGMKCCVYCGQANPEDAIQCQKCGAGFNQKQGAEGALDTSPADPGRLERITTLDNEVQASLVDAVLSGRSIPHVMQSYHDSALDGLFQAQKGWGTVLASADFKEEILEVVEDAKSKPNDPPSLGETEPEDKRWGAA